METIVCHLKHCTPIDITSIRFIITITGVNAVRMMLFNGAYQDLQHHIALPVQNELMRKKKNARIIKDHPRRLKYDNTIVILYIVNANISCIFVIYVNDILIHQQMAMLFVERNKLQADGFLKLNRILRMARFNWSTWSSWSQGSDIWHNVPGSPCWSV